MNFWKGVTNSVQRIVGGLVGEILGRSGGSYDGRKENEEEDADETEQDEGEDKQNADGEGDVDAAVAVSSLGASWEFETSGSWVSFDTGRRRPSRKPGQTVSHQRILHSAVTPTRSTSDRTLPRANRKTQKHKGAVRFGVKRRRATSSVPLPTSRPDALWSRSRHMLTLRSERAPSLWEIGIGRRI